MQDNRDDFEPIIADRRPRAPARDETQPLWRLVLALGGGLAVVVLLAWWLMGRSSNDSTTVQQESSTTEAFPEERVEQAPAPPARLSETDTQVARSPTAPVRSEEADVSQAPTDPPRQPETTTDVVQSEVPPAASSNTGEEIPQAPTQASRSTESPVDQERAATPDSPVAASNAPNEVPAPVSVRFTSPDANVRIELRGPGDSSSARTSKVGEAIDVDPGTYRVIASAPQSETLERNVIFNSGLPQQFEVELCAERKQERESLARRVVEERACASTEECESMFLVLSEYADQLVKDRAFRSQQCTKWRPNAVPDGRWTLDTNCGGATLATKCRIEITEGSCTFSEPARSVRGTQCPRAELR